VTTIAAPDIRVALFSSIERHRIRASLIVEDAGVLAGVRPAVEMLTELGLAVDHALDDGAEVRGGEEILRVSGTRCRLRWPRSGSSGCWPNPPDIATATAAFVARAAGRPRIVSVPGRNCRSVTRT